MRKYLNAYSHPNLRLKHLKNMPEDGVVPLCSTVLQNKALTEDE